MKLGIWTTIFTICTIIASGIFGRFCSRRDYNWIIILCSISMLSAATLLFINVTKINTLIYAFASAVCLEIMYQISSANVIDMARTKFIQHSEQTEYLIARDIMIFMGRWIAFVVLMYIGVFGLYKMLGIIVILSVMALSTGSCLSVSLTKTIDKNIKN